MTREKVLRLLHENMERIRTFGVERIALFGSVARNEQTDSSDIDILISFSAGQKSFDHYMDVKLFLEDLFQGIQVDVVVDDSLKERIRSFVYENLLYAS